jgi:hypothetical protein
MIAKGGLSTMSTAMTTIVAGALRNGTLEVGSPFAIRHYGGFAVLAWWCHAKGVGECGKVDLGLWVEARRS